MTRIPLDPDCVFGLVIAPIYVALSASIGITEVFRAIRGLVGRD